MFNFRTSRTRFIGAASTVVLAALSLTACNNGTGTRDEGAPVAATRTATSSAGAAASGGSSSGSGSHASAGGSSSSAGSSGSSGWSSGAKPATAAPGSAKHTSPPKAPGSADKPVTCEGSNTKTVAAPLNRPVNHMLLTVTNTGSKTCFLYGYPAVRFGEAQSVPPVIGDSQPQAVVTLQPGESGYASVNLSATDDSGANGYTAKSLTVYFQGRSMSGSVGKSARPALPAKGVYIDDSLKVTYWQQSMDDAVDW
ncbi:DUF4232 domain-containing protein [Streptomyces sp. NPDC001137]|uniref:DUF4232 domain-containing protein n=1 Tax=Streptomyces sp. NPDC001137 TaxID=3154378 RepID=UPI00331C4766